MRVLSLEDRADPVALLGSLVNAGATNRITVVFDAAGAAPGRASTSPVAGPRTSAAHPGFARSSTGLRELGYLG